ncbi:MAG: InlB B-repeat-containing protein, partial [Coriobacteriia bacterium]|nr:InlB B-repeat-containing protein [Coriobacteriia bacterium]
TIAEASTDVEINATNFPDAIFRNHVKTEFDRDNNDKLSQAELDAVTSIYVNNEGITSLQGIEYFTKLTSLNCTDNRISTIDLSKNTELETIHLSGNKYLAGDIGIGSNAKLKKLGCSDNKLTSLDVSNCSSLEYLDCDRNELTSLTIGTNSALKKLYFQNNKVPIEVLDLSKVPNLEKLLCGASKIKNLKLGTVARPTLTEFSCLWNSLASLDLSRATNLNLDVYNIGGQTVEVELNDSKLDLSALSEGLDITKVQDLNSDEATLEGNILTFKAREVNYNYNTGKGLMSVCLKATDPHQPNGTYKVEFETGGNGVINPQYITEGGKATKPVNPTKEGYTFDKWVDENGNEFNFNTPITSDIKLFASWSNLIYEVTFDTDGGSDVSNRYVSHNVKLEKPEDPTKTGHTFDKWVDENGIEFDFNTPITSNITLKATYKQLYPNHHEVKFLTYSTPRSFIKYVRHGGRVEKPEDPTMEGKTFIYWRDEHYIEFDFNTPITSDMTLTAGYHTNEYKVKFDTDGGSTIADQTVEYDKKASKPADPTKRGATFVKWVGENGNEFDFDNTHIKSDITLTATYERLPGFYEIRFVTDSQTKIPTLYLEDGEKVEKPADPTRTGYTFVKWVDGEGKEFDFEKAITSDITLKAEWKQVYNPITPVYVNKELTEAQDKAISTLAENIDNEDFNSEEQKKADEILKKAKAEIKEAKTKEEVAAVAGEAQKKIDALWSKDELDQKEKTESLNRDEFKSKSKLTTTKSGKRAIKITWRTPKGMEFDGFEVFRSTNRNKFGKTPYFVAKGSKNSYYNTKSLRKGRTYYYKVKAFKIVNGQKIYTGWSTKAWRKVR